MRAFTALWPSEPVNRELDALLEAHLDPAVWRAVDPARRHVTLCFHGEVDPADPPRPRAVARPWPRLRCAGAGCFGDALWLGVVTDAPARFAALVVAAGGDPGGIVPHLTVARRRRGADPRSPVPPGLAAHAGSWWHPGAITSVASGRPYRVLDRVVPA